MAAVIAPFALADMVVNDFNGDLFVQGQSGEKLRDMLHQHIQFPAAPGIVADTPAYARCVEYANPDDTQRVFAFTAAQLRQLSYTAAQYSAPGSTPMQTAFAAKLDSASIAKAAYLRVCVYRTGLYKPGVDPSTLRCTYNNCTHDAAVAAFAVPEAVVIAWRSQAAWREQVREQTSNILSLVAYVFRSRGHHYLDDLEDRYKVLFTKTLPPVDDIGLAWQVIATAVTHAVFPADLDAYWLTNAANATLAGALVKRVNCACAGMAVWYTVIQLGDDLWAAAPGLAARMAPARAALDTVRGKVAAANGRWYGSVNCHLYGAPALAEPESTIAPVAAAIRSIIEKGSPGNQLLNSKALERVAAAAPITGWVIAAGISEAVKGRANTETLLLPPVPK